jgi:TP901 family phage tail tape measure protein
MAIILPIVAAWNNKDLNRAIADIKRAEGAFQKFTTSTDVIGEGFKKVGKSLSMNVTAPLALMGGYAVNTAAEFEVSMASVQVNAQATGEQMKALSDLALKMGQDTVFSAGEAASAILELSKGGLQPAEIQAGALEAAMNLAATEGMGLADASVIIAQSMNTFNLQAKDTTRAVDFLAAGAVASTAGVQDLADGMKYVGSTASTLGVSMGDTITALAAMNNAGIDSTTAGTSLNRMLLGLIPTTRKAAKEAAELGLEFLNQDGSLKPMNEIVKELTDTYAGMGDAAKVASLKTVFGVEGMRAANTLIALGAEEYGVLTDAVHKQGIAQDLANARMSGTKGALEQLKGSVDTAAIAIGNALAPTVTKIAGMIQGLVDRFSKLSPETQSFIVTILGIVAAVGPLLVILGMAIGALGNLAIVFKTVGLAMQFLAMNPIGMLIVTIGLIVLGIKYLIDHWDLVKAKTMEVVEKIKNFVGSLKDFIVNMFKSLGEFIINNHPLIKLFRAIRDYAPTLIEKFKSIGVDLVNGLKQGISESWNSFKNFLLDKLGDPIKWAKKALGIASPSKVFANIGENVVAGYIQGINSMSAQLQNTVGEMALSSTVAFDGAVAPTTTPASSMSASSVYNINVNAGMGADGQVIGREIVDAIKRYERVSGPVFASA